MNIETVKTNRRFLCSKRRARFLERGFPEIGYAHILIYGAAFKKAPEDIKSALDVLHSIKKSSVPIGRQLLVEKSLLEEAALAIELRKPEAEKVQENLCTFLNKNASGCAREILKGLESDAYPSQERFDLEKVFLYASAQYDITGDAFYLRAKVRSLATLDSQRALALKETLSRDGQFDDVVRAAYCEGVRSSRSPVQNEVRSCFR